ncbi:Uncharacterized protein APZ42_028462 [Daphnia magna]|uniref:BEN domain-containing protein n=1 Tax=Daphnia magna TaxID=35525 RepID=A0A164QH68_9CRUS|nr:Uncharacterized protein APZ42_028462 [Daphnia magna]
MELRTIGRAIVSTDTMRGRKIYWIPLNSIGFYSKDFNSLSAKSRKENFIDYCHARPKEKFAGLKELSIVNIYSSSHGFPGIDGHKAVWFWDTLIIDFKNFISLLKSVCTVSQCWLSSVKLSRSCETLINPNALKNAVSYGKGGKKVADMNAMTNVLMEDLWDRTFMAQHSLSGKKAKNDKSDGPPKPALPAYPVQAIKNYVTEFWGKHYNIQVETQQIRRSISTKLSMEYSAYKKRASTILARGDGATSAAAFHHPGHSEDDEALLILWKFSLCITVQFLIQNYVTAAYEQILYVSFPGMTNPPTEALAVIDALPKPYNSSSSLKMAQIEEKYSVTDIREKPLKKKIKALRLEKFKKLKKFVIASRITIEKASSHPEKHEDKENHQYGNRIFVVGSVIPASVSEHQTTLLHSILHDAHLTPDDDQRASNTAHQAEKLRDSDRLWQTAKIKERSRGCTKEPLLFSQSHKVEYTPLNPVGVRWVWSSPGDTILGRGMVYQMEWDFKPSNPPQSPL